MFVKAIFESSFCYSFNRVNNVCRVVDNAVSNRSCFACAMQCVRSKLVGYVSGSRTMAAALKEPGGLMGGGGYFVFVSGKI